MSGSPPEDRRRREERESVVGVRTLDRTQSPPYRAPPPYRPRLQAPGQEAPATPPPPNPMPGGNQDEDNQQPGGEQPNNQAEPDYNPNANMPAEPGAVNPQQLTSLPVFNGDRGEGFVNWLECLETARQTYNWAED